MIVIPLLAAFGFFLGCHGAPTKDTIVAVPAQEIPLDEVKNVQVRVA